MSEKSWYWDSRRRVTNSSNLPSRWTLPKVLGSYFENYIGLYVIDDLLVLFLLRQKIRTISEFQTHRTTCRLQRTRFTSRTLKRRNFTGADNFHRSTPTASESTIIIALFSWKTFTPGLKDSQRRQSFARDLQSCLLVFGATMISRQSAVAEHDRVAGPTFATLPTQLT